MADIMKSFPPSHNSTGGSRASNGGQMPVKPIPYSTPQGPRKQMAVGVGSGHVEPQQALHEILGEMPGREFTGSPGIGGTNHGNKGTQGQH